jgi:predicted pyridoxine 5'-phosphate oxidase superfamily flavin-nucleotide-binding protein
VLPPGAPVVADFLRGSMVALVATVSTTGRPFLTPLWFVVDGGTLYLTTGTKTWAARNVAQQPEVALLLTGEALTRRGEALRLHGTATIQPGLPPWRVLLRIAAKYYAAPAALAVEVSNAFRWGLRARYYAQVKGGAGYLRVVPTGGEILPQVR